MTVSEAKTKIWIAGPWPSVLPTFKVGENDLKCVSKHKYVGITLSSTDRSIFKEHCYVKASKARKSVNALFGAENFVGNVPPKDGIAIYMATVDLHPMSACDISIDIDATLLTQLERIQKLFIRRLLGVANRSPVALLFSETGMWPVKYRRIILALRYWQYALSSRRSLFVHRYGRVSHPRPCQEIILDLRPRPCPASPASLRINGLSRQWLPSDIDNLITAVEQSGLVDIDSFIAASSKALLLRYRSLHRTDPSSARETPVVSFHSYLNVPIPAHRKALVRLLTSSHTLAVEVLRRAERRHPPVPRSQHLCRFCLSEVEDETHALWYCDGSQSLDDLRADFFKSVFLIATSHFADLLTSAASGFEVIHVLLGAI
ncbi:hypothetical protein ARMSODRAFT_962559 [Armillaria solidipes]|uniref:Reverse transcriptase zinc-binding domain-containing protein n=1 Tax=Armillaria solidipes TaxID=1076256 RepID=A0A2H3BDF9_9AGAR|nr:hypothetical protein ARMSODRAFT_962559 [Armillaria solidipes]